jgi:hypothetical protein
MRTPLIVIIALGLSAVPLASQDPAPGSDPARLESVNLPRPVAERVARFYNAPTTRRFSGPTQIAAGRIESDVAVLEGPVTLGGRIDGRLLVINGDVELLRGSAIRGDLTVIGGSVTGMDAGEVEGEIVLYRERLRYELRGDRIVLEGAPTRSDTIRNERTPRRPREERGSATLGISAASYNRVEGLPIYVGPVIQTAGADPFRLRAQAIVRTEGGFSDDENRIGYLLQAEQFLGGRQAFRVGGSLHSQIRPIEDWPLSDLENGLSTFLFALDNRDHYETEGGRVFARYAPRRSPISWTAEWRSETHRSVPAGDPWTLFVRDPEWRLQPLAAEGRLTSAVLGGRVDTRDGRRFAASGWRIEGQLEQALTSSLARPELLVPLPVTGPVLVPEVSYGTFTHARVDLRRYERVGPQSRLAMRGFLAGALRGELPPQRQHVLGGIGTLPAFPLFQLDCGARRQLVHRAEDVAAGSPPGYFPEYGCQGAGLLQVEYRGDLRLRVRPHGRDDDDLDHGHWHSWSGSPDWIVFMDAGRTRDTDGDLSPVAVDAGMGLLLGQVGFYLAVPIQGDGGRTAFFVRVGPRF